MVDSGRYALVVSSSRYAHPSLRPLSAPGEDAESLEECLRDRNVGDFRVRPVLDQPSWVVAQEVEKFFSERRLNDLALFYFSGHGIKDEDGALYFATMNTDPGSLLATTVSSQHVLASMRKCRSRRQVLILDCCYAGAFSKAMLAKGSGRVGIQERFSDDGAGRVVLAASDAMQIALDGSELHGETTLSAFTRILVDGIRDGDADQDRDGHISLDELYDYVYERMLRDHPDQTPTISNLDQKGRSIVIALNPRVQAPVVDDGDEIEELDGDAAEEEPHPDPAAVEESADAWKQPAAEPTKGVVESEPAEGAFERLTRSIGGHRRLAIGVGAGVLVAAIAVVAAVLLGSGASNDQWALAGVDPGGLGPHGTQLAGVAAVPGSAAIAVGRHGPPNLGFPMVWDYDGTSWTKQPQDEVNRGNGQMSAVAASGGRVVAVGLVVQSKADIDAMAWRRSSGGSWVQSCSRAVCGGKKRQEMLAVASVTGGLIAVGRDSSSGSFDGAVWRGDATGGTWTRIPVSDPSLVGPANQAMRGVTEAGDRIVAVGRNGDDGAVWTSRDDGASWRPVQSSAFRSVEGHSLEVLGVDIVDRPQGPRWVAVGREIGADNVTTAAAAWFSDDGEDWSRATIDNVSFSGQQMIAVASRSHELVAVGNSSDSRAGVWHSSDGASWSAVASDSFYPQSGMMGVALLRGGAALAVGSSIWAGAAP